MQTFQHIALQERRLGAIIHTDSHIEAAYSRQGRPRIVLPRMKVITTYKYAGAHIQYENWSIIRSTHKIGGYRI